MATIVTKNSSTASAVPTTSDLVQGELAVNVTDKRIFTENASTQIVELGTNPSTVTTATATVTGTLTANGTFASSNAVITGGSINSTPIGATTPSTVRGSTVTATTGFVGGLTGNVTGNLTGNVTGNVTGDLTGNVTGNVTASSGTTTLNDLVVNGTADFTNTKLTNVTTPTADSDAANKSYVDDTVAAVIDSAPAALDTLNELAAALGDDANFAGTVTTALATKLPLAGGTMTGAIAMGTSKITGLGNPTSAQDATTKTYVDTADALKLNLTGGTMSGAIAMGTNKITGVGNPTLAQDAATKDYVDDILGSATSAATSAAAAATSASSAATSASNAASSATASANSASAAAASYDAFDDRYLGDKASDPTLDNDGNALLTGALYFNTTSDVMKVYDGSAWNIAAISSASPTFTGTVTADGLSLGDNDKATFGAGNDLEIYHDGSNSYIKDTGTGRLTLQSSSDFLVSNTANTQNYIYAQESGYVRLYHAGATKLATTSTGIDVTGTATMDGLTVDGDVSIADAQTLYFSGTIGDHASINYTDDDPDTFTINFYQNGQLEAGMSFASDSEAAAGGKITLNTGGTPTALFADNGDISFYEDTGTTPKFFWDASAESLGIGTTSPASYNSKADDLVVLTSADTGISIVSGTSSEGAIVFADGTLGGDPLRGRIRYSHSTDSMDFRVNNAEAMRIDSSGNVGIGVAPNAWLSTFRALQLGQGSSLWGAATGNNAGFDSNAYVNTSGGSVYVGSASATRYQQSSGQHRWFIAPSGTAGNTISFTQAMTLDSNGNVGIGNTVASTINTANGVGNLVVGSGSGSEGITIYTGTTGIGGVAFADGTTTTDTYRGYLKYAHSADEMSLWTAATQRLTIDSSGNVGIGNTDPSGYSSRLVVDGGRLTIASGNKMGFWDAANLGRFEINSPSYHALAFYTDAGTERMRIDSSGNVGIGTSSPDSGGLHIDTSGGTLTLERSGTGFDAKFKLIAGGLSGGGLRIQDNTTDRFTIDGSGNIGIGTNSPSSFSAVGRNLVIGSTASGDTGLSLITNSTATNNICFGDSTTTGDASRRGKITYDHSNNSMSFDTLSSERMRIDSSGNLLVGTTTSTGKLTVNGNTVATTNTNSLGTTGWYGVRCNGTVGSIDISRDGSNVLAFYHTSNASGVNGSPVGTISITTTTTSYNTSSDQRLKENIADADDAGNKVDAIKVRQFDWKADGSHQDYGMVAQELMTVAPEAVSVPENSEDMMGVDYSKLVPMLIKEIQSLRNRVATLEGN